jgi:outer membrane protein assembly factor BamB
MGQRVRWVAACALALFSISPRAQVNVTTYHNDNSRTGQNLQESILTPANVNSTKFGKLFTVTVDGTVYAQPLYLADVSIGGGTHNVLYVATEHDSIFAIDADTGTLYWQKSLIPAGGSTVSSSADLNCTDIPTEVGITGTPVIDPTTGTLYVVAKVKLNGDGGGKVCRSRTD